MFSFKGKSAKDFGLVVREVETPLLPSATHRTINVSNMHGAIDVGRKYEPREITVQIGIKGDSYESVRSQARTIAAWLNSDKLEKLVLEDEPDKYYMARIVDDTDLKPLFRYEETSVTFIATNPFAISQKPKTVKLSKNNSKKVTVAGTAETFPVFNILMDAASDNFTISVKNEKYGTVHMKLFDKFIKGEPVVVDCQSGTIRVDNRKANILSLDSDLATLVNGENTITCSGSGTVEMTYTDRWL
ncbi:distal tail protein Dit [Alkalicoccobacillus gibsonii]|uniref:distal tail protein Dit n=1 Tax=Alkalicoccobacillus gibsonii TaxID=79881 RepID=UPI0035183904